MSGYIFLNIDCNEIAIRREFPIVLTRELIPFGCIRFYLEDNDLAAIFPRRAYSSLDHMNTCVHSKSEHILDWTTHYTLLAQISFLQMVAFGKNY
jgi:hypothetical protein